MAVKEKRGERSRRSRTLVVAAGVVEVVLLVATLIDIKHRPADQIKGSKRMWTALAFINIVGPISYFAVGRRQQRGATADSPAPPARNPASISSVTPARRARQS